MKSILIYLFFTFNANQLNYSLIPKCYLDYPGTTIHKLRTSFRQNIWYSHYVEFPVSKVKKGYHTISDGFTEIFEDTLGQKFAEINIQLSTSKKYKNDVLSSYQFYENKRKIFQRPNEVSEFLIGNTSIYRTTQELMGTGFCGSYVFFPSDKMAIYLQFYPCSRSKNLDSSMIVQESKLFINSYLNYINSCLDK